MTRSSSPDDRLVDRWLDLYTSLLDSPVAPDHCPECERVCAEAGPLSSGVLRKVNTKTLATSLVTVSVHMLRIFKHNTGLRASTVKSLDRPAILRCCLDLVSESRDIQQMLGIALEACMK